MSRTEDRTPPGLPKGSVRVERREWPPSRDSRTDVQTEPSGTNLVLIVDGYDVISKVNNSHRAALKRWLHKLKNSDNPYKLRPTHVVTRSNKTYHYPGTYWFKYNKKTRRWDYVGKELPKDVDTSKIPKIPQNPLDGFLYERVGRSKSILVPELIARRYRKFFDGFVIFAIARSGL